MSKVITVTTILLLVSFATSSCGVGCIKCSSADECQMCDFQSGYKMTQSGCAYNRLSNCLTQSINGSCLKCAMNYYVDVQSQKCVAVDSAKLINNCKYYSDGNSCSQCNSGYYLTSNKCQIVVKQILNCVNALGPSLCQECASGYILSADNASCTQISSINSCMLYSTIECSKCKAGFAYNVNALLYELNNYADSESQASKTKALRVASNSIIPTAPRCSAIIVDNCNVYQDFETCATCNSGYYVAADGKCAENPISVIPHCSTYLSINVCTECEQGYFLESATSCKQVTAVTKCAVYDATANTTKCALCDKDYYVSNNACVMRTKSVDGCVTYTPDQDTCSACSGKNVPTADGLKCLPSISFCDTYVTSTLNDSALTCAKCEDNFYWNGSACVLGNTLNCLRYVATQNVCQICNDGYYINNNNKCVAHNKTLNCDEYDNYVADKCVQCNDKSLQLTKESACVEVFIAGCDQYISETKCGSCQKGYNLNANNTCSLISTEFNCYKMVEGQCHLCKEGYLLDNGLCRLPVSNFTKNCLQTNIDGTIGDIDKVCIKCNNGSIFYNYKHHYECLDVQYVQTTYNKTLASNCLGYRYVNNNLVCNKCQAGYYLKNNNCVSGCADTDTLRPFTLEYDSGDSSYSIASVNNCINSTNQCKIQYPSGQQSNGSLVNYSCAQCNTGYHSIVDISSNSSFAVKGQHIDAVNGANLFFDMPEATCDSTVEMRTGEVNQCRYYYPLIDQTLGCLNCKFGYSGVVNNFVVNNCYKYDNQNAKCIACQQGYYLKNAYICAPVVTITGCDLYSITASTSYCVKCSQANPIYYLSSGNCVLINTPIANCSAYSIDSATCEACAGNYIFNGDKTVCFQPINNCVVHDAVISSSTVPTCKQCASRFLPNSDYTQCVQNINLPECWEFEQVPNGKCLHQNLVPFYVNATCSAPNIISNCTSYTDVNTCNACDSTGYYLQNNKCVPYGKFADASGNVKAVQVANCSVAADNSGNLCSTCKPGYFRIVNTTNSVDTHYCCPNGSFLSNGQCTQSVTVPSNTFNCSVYNLVKSVCMLCSSGYYISGNSCCPTGQYFNSTTQACADIQTGLSLQNCAQVNSTDTTKCAVCTNPYVLSSDHCCTQTQYYSNGSCIDMPSNCSAIDANSACQQCISGYYLSSGKCCASGKYFTGVANTDCVTIPTLFSSCLQFDGTNCLKCADGFSLDSTGAACCPKYTQYVNGKCISTSLFYNYCADITSDANKTCASCKSGSYSNNGICVPLGSYVSNASTGAQDTIANLLQFNNCDQIDAQNKCTTCSANYYAVMDGTTIKYCCPAGTQFVNNNCVPLDALFNFCASFDWTTLKCKMCVKDSLTGVVYYPHKGVCVAESMYFDVNTYKNITISGCLRYDDSNSCAKCQLNSQLISNACVINMCFEQNGGSCTECSTPNVLNSQTSQCVSSIDFLALGNTSSCASTFVYCKNFDPSNPCNCNQCKNYTYGVSSSGSQYCCPYNTHLSAANTCDKLAINQCAIVDAANKNCTKCFIDDDNCTVKDDFVLYAKNMVRSDGTTTTVQYSDYSDYHINYISNGTCCKKGYYKSTTSDFCIAIPISNCAEVDINNVCTVCKDDYFLTFDSTCCRYDQNYDIINKVCVASSVGRVCGDGMYLSNSHCCNNGYFWNSSSSRCEPLLDTKCLNADKLGACKLCASGYYFDSATTYKFELKTENINSTCLKNKIPIVMGLCVPVVTTLTPLVDNTLISSNCSQLDTVNQVCALCKPSSYMANNNCCPDNMIQIGKIVKDANGIVLSRGYCTSINTFLDGCTNYSNTDSQCLECATGYTLQRGICCKTGYYLDLATGNCTVYHPFCQDVNVESKSCSSCGAGSYAQGDTCCAYGTFFDDTTGTCTTPSQAESYLSTCTVFANQNTCLSCDATAGMYLSNGKCCPLGYEFPDSGAFTTCQKIAVDNCASASGGNCIVCASDDYYVSNNKCVKKGTIVTSKGVVISGSTVDPSCSQFDSTGTNCLSCKTSSGVMLYVSNGKCCKANTYYNTTSKACVAVSDPATAFCSQMNKNACVQCKAGYYLNTLALTCCPLGQYWSGSRCKPIAVLINCLKTDDDKLPPGKGCTLCNDKATLLTNEKRCVLNTNFTPNCVVGYTVKSGSTTINYCSTCVAGYNLVSGQRGCCPTKTYYNTFLNRCVTIRYCKTPDYNTSTCSACTDNTVNTTYYYSTSNPDCCPEYYYYDYQTGSCKPITETACMRKSNNIGSVNPYCTKCALTMFGVNYYLDATQKKCVARIQTCATYSNTGDSCYSCQAGKVLNSSDYSCGSPSNPVTSCSNYNGYTGACGGCSGNTIPNYSSPGVVNSCMPDTKSVPSTDPTYYCEVFANGVCIKCYKNNYWNGQHCTGMSSYGCKFNYFYVDACIECDPGYYLNPATKGCAARVNSSPSMNCALPSLQSDACLQCYAGYRIDVNGKCVSALAFDNCKKPSKYLDFCEVCEDGYTILYNTIQSDTTFQAKTNMCVAASTLSANIQGCNAYDTTYTCLSCENTAADGASWENPQAFYLVNGSCTAVIYVENCKLFDMNTGLCTSCYFGYYLSGGACVATTEIDNCIEYSVASDSCSGCDDGFYLSANTCNPVTAVADCGAYDPLTGLCATCNDGFYLSSNTCNARTTDDNCRYYSPTTDACSLCQPGFYNKTVSTRTICTLYDEIPLCYRYDPNSNSCIECAPGYYPLNSGCMPIAAANLQSTCRFLDHLSLYCSDGSACARKYTCADNSTCQFYSVCPNSGDVCIVGSRCLDGSLCASQSTCDDGTTCNANEICWNGKACPTTPMCADGTTCKLENRCSDNSVCVQQKFCTDGTVCTSNSQCSDNKCDYANGCRDCYGDSYHTGHKICTARTPSNYSSACMSTNPNKNICNVCYNYTTKYPNSTDSGCTTRATSNCFIVNPFSNVCKYCKKDYYISGSTCVQRTNPKSSYVYSQTSAAVIGCSYKYDYFTGTTCSRRTIASCTNYSSKSLNCAYCAWRQAYINNNACSDYKLTINIDPDNAPTSQDVCKIFQPNDNYCLVLHDTYYYLNNIVNQIINCAEIDTVHNLCLTCQDFFYLDDEYQCQTVTKENCIQFVTNTNDCQVCDPDGYHLESGSCIEDGMMTSDDGTFTGIVSGGLLSNSFLFSGLDSISNDTIVGCAMIDNGVCLGCDIDNGFYMSHNHCCQSGTYWKDTACTQITGDGLDKCLAFDDTDSCISCDATTYLNFNHCCSPGFYWDSTIAVPACTSNSSSTNPNCSTFYPDSMDCTACQTNYYMADGLCCSDGKYNNNGTCSNIVETSCLQKSNNVCIKCSTYSAGFSNDQKCCLSDGVTASMHYDDDQGCIVNPVGCYDYNGTCLKCNGDINSSVAGYQSGVTLNTGQACCNSSNMYFKPSTKTCVALLPAEIASYGNCIIAEDPASCMKCAAGYIMRNGLCTDLATNFNINGTIRPFSLIRNVCKQMNPDGTCKTCQVGYYASNGLCCRLGEYWNGSSCAALTIPLCQKGTANTCTQCDNGYNVQNSGAICCSTSQVYMNGACTTSSIANCTSIAAGVCTSCATGYHIDNAGLNCCADGYEYVATYSQCKPLSSLIQNCFYFNNLGLTCKSDGCDTVNNYYLSDGFCCKKGTMWDRTSNSCIPITEKYCAVYNGSTKVCSECSTTTGHYLVNNKCCPIGTYYSTNSKMCNIISQPYCAKYDGVKNTCMDCGSYNLYNGVCCPDNYFYKTSYSDLVCRAPIKDCVKYDQTGACLQCKNNKLIQGGVACCPVNTFYDSTSGTCNPSAKINSSCKEYDSTTFNCRSCISGYNLYEGTCCANGNYYNSKATVTDNKACYSISSVAQNCDVYDVTNAKCATCSSGYYLNASKICTINPTSCKAANSDGTCNTCADGFYTSKGNCCAQGAYFVQGSGCTTSTVPHCLMLDDNTNCKTCESGYYLVQQACCANGTYFENGQCKSGAIPSCLTYTDKNNCSQCAQNYAVSPNYDGTNVYQSCFPINLENCVSATISTATYQNTTINSISCNLCQNNGVSYTLDTSNPQLVYLGFRRLDDVSDQPFDPTDADDCLNYEIANTLDATTYKCRMCELNEINYFNGTACQPRVVTNLDKCTGYDPLADKCTACSGNYYLVNGVCTAVSDPTCLIYDPVNSECRVCKDSYKITYKTASNKNECTTDYGISQPLNPLYYSGYITSCAQMTTCASTMYEGLGSNLEMLYSCHKCKSDSKIPFVSVTLGSQYNQIQGIQQYFLTPSGTFDESANGYSTNCIAPAPSTFGLQTNATFNFPENCALGMLNADLTPNAEHATDPSSVDKSKLSIFCAACKPGFKPLRDSTFSLRVYSCTAISKCVSSTRVNGCSVCSAGYVLNYNTVGGVDYSSCVPTGDANCYAAYNGTKDNKCAICNNGYSLNPDGVCEMIDTLNCSTGNFSFINSFKITDFKQVVKNNPYGAGCHKCQSGFVGLYQEKEDLQCTVSSYINHSTRAVNTVFDAHCYVYNQINGKNYCDTCNSGYILTKTNTCIQINSFLQGCSVAKSPSTCAQCVSGYSLINQICVQHNKSNCSSYDDMPVSNTMTCTKCNSGYYLKNNNCYKGAVLQCDTFTSETVCTKCSDGLALVHLKDNQTQCLPISTHSNCVQYDSNSISSGTLKCSQCASGSYLLENLSTPVEVCNPVRMTDFCVAYDINSDISTSTLKCKTCDDGYVLSNNTCIERTVTIDNCATYADISNICSTCTDGFYLNADSTACIADPSGIPGCETYSSENSCKRCGYNKYLSNNACVSVDSGSLITNCTYYSDATTCQTCASGYTLENKVCVSATAANCATYNSSKACASCPANYVLKTTGDVINCVAKTPIANCSSSSDSDVATCLECNNNYFVATDGSCSPVTSKVSNCTVYSNATTCSGCAENYLLLNGACVAYTNDDGCSRRFASNTPVCAACVAGYQLNANLVCVPVAASQVSIGCLFGSTGPNTTCSICATGYSQDKTGSCVLNTSSQFASSLESSSILSSLILSVLVALMW